LPRSSRPRAAERGLPRGEGHRRGVDALRRTVRVAGELGIEILTVFSFSSENWSRPAVPATRQHGGRDVDYA
jgi:undecaprenyl diphosphate synthase